MKREDLHVYEWRVQARLRAVELQNALAAFGNDFERLQLAESLAPDTSVIVSQLKAVETELQMQIIKTRKDLTSE